jgi:hypothetical protein
MDQSTGLSKAAILSIGEEYHLKFGKDRIMYAGMLSEDVYSIAQRKNSGYQGYAWNLFFPKNRRDITIDGVRLYVERITPEEIQFRIS